MRPSLGRSSVLTKPLPHRYVNLLRVPWCGRAYETLGEDPILAGEMAAAEIRGAQSQGVCAVVKHLADYNDQAKASADKSFYSASVPDRAQRELYTPAFATAVNAGVASVMCSYNQINGTPACEDKSTLSFLRDPGALFFSFFFCSFAS
jgi:beta-glucosidase